MLNHQTAMTTMAKTKITLRAKHPDRTETFVMVIQTALETFDDEIASLTQEVRMKAYKNFIKLYRTALTVNGPITRKRVRPFLVLAHIVVLNIVTSNTARV